MDLRAWKALRDSLGPTRVVVWICGDHGGDRETEVELRSVSGEIRVTRREFQCDEQDHRGKLLSEEHQ